MKKIKYIGDRPCSVQGIDGGYIGNIKPGQVIRISEKDYKSLMDLSTRTSTPEWESNEKPKEQKVEKPIEQVVEDEIGQPVEEVKEDKKIEEDTLNA